MKAKLYTFLLILLLSLGLASFSALSPSKGQLLWSTNTQIEVFSDGLATWVVSRSTLLSTDEEESAFYHYLNITSVDQISSSVHSMVDRASLVTGRSMSVERLEVIGNISTTGLNKIGVLQYEFNWIGFAERIDDERIKVGGSLSGELDLAPDDMLTIKYPSAYAPVFVYPVPDKNYESEATLVWFGRPRNFGAGEPIVVLDKRGSSWTDVIMSNITILSVIAVAIPIGLLGYLLGMKRGFGKKGSMPTAQQMQPVSSGPEVQDYEEKVIKLLVASGGRMLQSTIAKQCGFSKSKASELLSTMERKSIVARKKTGRAKVVTLIKNKEGRKE